jgi:hypothetical protein
MLLFDGADTPATKLLCNGMMIEGNHPAIRNIRMVPTGEHTHLPGTVAQQELPPSAPGFGVKQAELILVEKPARHSIVLACADLRDNPTEAHRIPTGRN